MTLQGVSNVSVLRMTVLLCRGNAKMLLTRDLTPLDLFLWGHLKSLVLVVYKGKAKDLPRLTVGTPCIHYICAFEMKGLTFIAVA